MGNITNVDDLVPELGPELKSAATKKAIVEATKSFARAFVFFAVSWGIAYLTSLPEGPVSIAGLFALRWIDKYIHENENWTWNGLLPF